MKITFNNPYITKTINCIENKEYWENGIKNINLENITTIKLHGEEHKVEKDFYINPKHWAMIEVEE
ncbi:hypothetical protein KQI68_06850 [Peptoniphilus sp. MSJ-1]|uniref:Uncharacterized protein n=1 Tax=Peptoniphilus ovalis TaxID=2841503 RepID=A0ABS6FJ77_9FIRM|nr:hypothetical protein [Peptoniphilus ovalis]MBU5669557.1 hypothetical protein [Peptoniphilus ovalis]